MGPITENALEELSLVANLSQYIKVRQDHDADLKQYMPVFFWVLRDFFHDLEGQTPKQYLEECLQASPGLSVDVMRKNKIREALVANFKERECFTMIRPVTDESKLAHIDDLKWEDLKLDFRKQVTQFIN